LQLNPTTLRLVGDEDSSNAVKFSMAPAGLQCISGLTAPAWAEIARAAGVSKGTLYVYFADKNRLFEAIVEEEVLDQQKVAFNFDPNATSPPRCGSSARPISSCCAGRAVDRRSVP